jgi:hypothetical protein
MMRHFWLVVYLLRLPLRFLLNIDVPVDFGGAAAAAITPVASDWLPRADLATVVQ